MRPRSTTATRLSRTATSRVAVDRVADRLAREGLGRGDRVGVRIPSGTVELYVAVLGVLAVGAAYVPVDHDDPDARARLVFDEADVVGRSRRRSRADAGAARTAGGRGRVTRRSSTTTPGSSSRRGRPVSRRASLSATARPRLRRRGGAALPAGRSRSARGDRVLAGLSVAFDASLRGDVARLAPRRLPRAGAAGAGAQRHRPRPVAGRAADHGRVDGADPGLAVAGRRPRRGATAHLRWRGVPARARRAAGRRRREVWNTYGPTEATVVACAARLGGRRAGADRPAAGRLGPRRGRTRTATPVADGEVGELVIGGVGLARYLDPAKDAEKFAPLPDARLGRAPTAAATWCGTSRTGCCSSGRADDQVKLGGRRIELGEVDAALQRAARRRRGRGRRAPDRRPATTCSSATSRPTPASTLDLAAAQRRLREALPAPLVPAARPRRRPARPAPPARSTATRCPGRCPVAVTGRVRRPSSPAPRRGWPSAGPRCSATAPASLHDDFFEHGGGSLAAAQLVSALRDPVPRGHRRRRLRQPTTRRPRRPPSTSSRRRSARWTRTRAAHAAPRPASCRLLAQVPVVTVTGLRWLRLARRGGQPPRPAGRPCRGRRPCRGGGSLAGWLLLVSPPGRIARRRRRRAAAAARGPARHVPARRQRPPAVVGCRAAGRRRRAENLVRCRLDDRLRAGARRARSGRASTCTRCRRSPGCSRSARARSVESEVDLAGHWLDGDVLHVGRVRIGPGATVGSRSTLLPGARDRPGRRGRRRVGGGRLGAGRESAGAVRRRCGSGWPRHRWPERPAAASAALGRRLRTDRGGARRCCRCWPRSPALAVIGRRRARRRRRSGTRCPPRCWPSRSRCGRRARRSPLLTVGRCPAARARAASWVPPGAQPHRVAGVGDRALARRGPDAPLPALREPGHAGLAAAARGQGRQGRRGLDRPAAAADDHHRRRGVPRRRHDDRRPTSSAAAGCASSRRRSASAPSSATPA